jgi:hypothetical protein
MSKSYFSKELNQKIIYKIPLFILTLNLNKEKKGGDEHKLYETESFSYNMLVDQKNIRLRFMNALHNTIDDASLLLRQIFMTKDINIYDLQHYVKLGKDTQTNSLDNIANDILNNIDTKVKCPILFHPFRSVDNKKIKSAIKDLYTEVKKTKCVIYKIHDVSQDKTAKEFLLKWYKFMDDVNGNQTTTYFRDVDTELDMFKKAGFTIDSRYTPTNDIYNNPLYIKYIKLVV